MISPSSSTAPRVSYFTALQNAYSRQVDKLERPTISFTGKRGYEWKPLLDFLHAYRGSS